MDKKHKLTEELKVLETIIYDQKVDLKSIERKLNSLYDYEADLNKRMIYAKEQTEKQRLLFIEKSKEISKEYTLMKDMLDVFTGNFYTN
jgi:hypothetical protein